MKERFDSILKVRAAAAACLVALFVVAGAAAGTDSGARAAALRDIDTDGNTAITQGEFESYVRARATEADLDSDGTINLKELQSFREKLRARRQAQRFARLDIDGNGRVSVDEVATMRARWFMRRDTDGDGVVAAEELVHARRDRDPTRP